MLLKGKERSRGSTRATISIASQPKYASCLFQHAKQGVDRVLISQRAPVSYVTKRTLHLVASHQVHGTITGLAPLRTMESAADGLDRLLVSFKDAKMAILEWVGGDIATVSLHTYERAIQMTTGDMSVYEPLLRSDPLSRLAVLTLPDDALAVLPLTQDQSELDPLDAYPRWVSTPAPSCNQVTTR